MEEVEGEYFSVEGQAIAHAMEKKWGRQWLGEMEWYTGKCLTIRFLETNQQRKPHTFSEHRVGNRHTPFAVVSQDEPVPTYQ